MSQARVLVIGLEMGDERLILDGCTSGKLPVLKGLLDRGAWGWLESTAGVLNGSAWPSIYTGVSPGQHGVYHQFQALPGRQGYVPFFNKLYGAPTFWQILSASGVRCTVFDAPYTYRESGFRGRQILDWATWEQFVGKRSTPRSLVHRLRFSNGPYPLRPTAEEAGLGHQPRGAMKDRLLRAARAKARAATWLLERSEFDLFVVAFSETNPAGRYLWQRPVGKGAAEGDRPPQPELHEVYAEIDRGIGSLLRSCDDDTTIFVLSGDGVSTNAAGWHLLPEVLRRLDYLAIQDGLTHLVGAGPEQEPIRLVRDLLPDGLRRAVGRRLPGRVRNYIRRRVGLGRIDWSRTRAYCLPTDREGYIRINLQGREPQGTVAPGMEYRDLCDDIATVVKEMVDPATGRPVVREVVEGREAFPGLRSEHLPDLIVKWSGERPITALTSPRFGKISGSSPDARPGTRGPPGFVLVVGPGVEAGRAFRGHIFDVAPTILTLLGHEPRAYMEGSSWVSPPAEGARWV